MDGAARLEAHVGELAGAIGERNVFRPQAVRAQAYDAYGVRCANLEATRPGLTRPQQILLIGAHYDTVRGCPGANDNGSGVAALLEISRFFAALTPALTVRFVAFVNEEPPFFLTRRQGSAVYAKAARARGDDIRLMASLETLGYYSDAPGSQRSPPLFRFFYPDRGNFLGLVSDLRSRRVMRRVATAFREHSEFPLE